MLNLLHDASITRLVQIALGEDVGTGDITTEYTIPESARARASFVCKSDGVICGLPLAELVFRTLADDIAWTTMAEDGTVAKRGDIIARVEGSAHALLAGERTALNFVQRMSGVASMAKNFSDAVAHTKARILDTRKTIPGWRRLDKYATHCGGAVNHRMGLYDMVMIKDNHIVAAGGIRKALTAVREVFDAGRVKIEIECDSLADVQEALACGGFHNVLFDNFDTDHLRVAVKLVDGKYQTEASGGITLSSVAAVAETGVDFISAGAITHSSTALDISMEIAVGV